MSTTTKDILAGGKTVEILVSGRVNNINKRFDITTAVVSISPFTISIDDPLLPAQSSYLSVEVDGNALIEDARLSSLIESNYTDTIEVFLCYKNLKKLIFKGYLGQIERCGDFSKHRYLLKYNSGIKSIQEIGVSELAPLSPPPFSHPVRDILPYIASSLGIGRENLIVESPNITLSKPSPALIGYPRIDRDIYHNPSAITYDTKRGILYCACNSNIYSFSEDNGFKFVAGFKKKSRFRNGTICHLEYDCEEDLIRGIVSFPTTRTIDRFAGLKGEFTLDLSIKQKEIEEDRMFYHYDDVIYIRSSTLNWRAPNDGGEVVAEGIGWVQPETGGEISQFYDGTIITAEMPIGDYSYEAGSHELSIMKHSLLMEGMRVGCYLIDEMNDFSDLGFIKKIKRGEEKDTIFFDYPTRYEYNGGDRRGIIFELSSPPFSRNIFIPKVMEVDIAYADNMKPHNPVTVFRRQGYEGMEDIAISTEIGHLPMTLDIGFYAFRSQAPYISRLKRNAPTSPFYIILRERRNRFYNLSNGLKLVSERQTRGANGEQMGGDSPTCILNHIEYGDILKTSGNVYVVRRDDGTIIACLNEVEREDNYGMSGIKRVSRIVQFDPSTPDLINTLWSNKESDVEFTGNPVIKGYTLLIPARRVSKHFIETNIRIIGVEPLIAGEDVPSDYSGHNRASAKIFMEGDLRDILKEGMQIRLKDENGYTVDRDYILQNIGVNYLEDRYFCHLGYSANRFVTRAYIVGAKTSYPWDYLRAYQEREDDPFSSPPGIDFGEMWEAYIESDAFRRKYTEGLEDEFCSKTLSICAGYKPEEPFIMVMDLRNNQVSEIKIPEIEVNEEKYTVEKIPNAFLPGITLNNLALPSSIRLKVKSTEIEVEDGGEYYQLPVICGTNSRGLYIRYVEGERILPVILLPPEFIGSEVSISYKYRKYGAQFRHICVVRDRIYAFEEITGRFFTIDTNLNIEDCDLLWCDETGTRAICAYKSDLYSITNPDGLILKLGTNPPDIVRYIGHSDKTIEVLKKTLLSFNYIAYLSPTGTLHIRRRGSTLGYLNLDMGDIIEVDATNQPNIRKVRLCYEDGEVVAGYGTPGVRIKADYITAKGVAEYLSETYLKAINCGPMLEVKIPIHINATPLNLVKLPPRLFPHETQCHEIPKQSKTQLYMLISIDYDISQSVQTLTLMPLYEKFAISEPNQKKTV